MQPKYLINSDNFKSGYVTTDDHWDNYYRQGANQVLGFDARAARHGQRRQVAWARSWRTATASRSARWRRCSRRCACAIRAMPRIAPRCSTIKATFKSTGYKMKQVFADAAIYCMGN